MLVKLLISSLHKHSWMNRTPVILHAPIFGKIFTDGDSEP
jgi:hypothetical protein